MCSQWSPASTASLFLPRVSPSRTQPPAPHSASSWAILISMALRIHPAAARSCQCYCRSLTVPTSLCPSCCHPPTGPPASTLCLHSLLCNGWGHLLKTQIRASHSLMKLQSPCPASKLDEMQPCPPPNPSLLQVAPVTPRAAAGGAPCFSVYLFLCPEVCQALAWTRCSLILAD